MALNYTFTCNNIVDENLNTIDCYYQGFHVESKTWNNTRISSLSQYSANLGDGDWLTQTGNVSIGDTVILCFWTDVTNSTLRSGIKDRFCSIEVTINSSSIYINDVKLTPKTAPINSFIFVNDDYSYTYNNITHYHYRSLYNEIMFNSIGNITSKFDWSDGLGFDIFKTKTYTSIGTYNVSQNGTNSYGLSSLYSLPLNVYYNAPIPGINFVYVSPIHTTEDVTVNAGIVDIDSTITNIQHKLLIRDRNTGILSQDTIINENITLNYSYLHTIALLQIHLFTQVLYWNDGFTNRTINYNKELPIENWCPIVSIVKQDNTNSNLSKTFIQTSQDIDGSIVNYKWEILFIPPFSTSNYTVVYTYNTTLPDNWLVDFTVGGKYKVQLTVTDDYGCSTSDSILFDIIADCPKSVSSNINNIKFIFPKHLANL